MTPTLTDIRRAAERGAARRADRIARQDFHLVCPLCEWIVLPPDGLIGERMLRLVEHLDGGHEPTEPGLPDLRIAITKFDRITPRPDPFYPAGNEQ